MSKSAIEWTNEVWNPVTGCTKASAGCKHCYAERQWPRMTRLVPAYAGREFTDVRCHPERLEQPLHWKKPRRIFVNSMSDLFHPDVSSCFIDEVFAVMTFSPQHTFQILTKRADRMAEYMRRNPNTEALRRLAPKVRGLSMDAGEVVEPWPRRNIWLGVSVENQETADDRIPLLLDTRAYLRWISAEPLLGAIHLDEHGLHGGPGQLDWVVVGGESGPKARPMHPGWALSLRDQCAAAGVPFMFKQWGEWAPRSDCYHTLTSGQAAADIDPSATKWPCIRLTYAGNNGRDLANACDGDDCYMQKVGKKLSGRLIEGVLQNGFPA